MYATYRESSAKERVGGTGPAAAPNGLWAGVLAAHRFSVIRPDMRTGLLTLALVLGITAAPAQAQLFELDEQPPRGPSRAFVGGALLLGIPRGDFSHYVGTGGGMAGHFIYQLDPAGTLAIRFDGGFLIYGQERKRVCFSATVGCRITVDVTTTNSIFFLGLGPQLIAPSGQFRPYATGSIGFGLFSTESSVSGSGETDPFARTTNYSDATFAWTGAGGVYIPLRSGMRPMLLDIGARYHGNGEVNYLNRGSIQDHEDGSITITPIRSQANLLVLHLGVTVGL